MEAAAVQQAQMQIKQLEEVKTLAFNEKTQFK
jgi:hypothetical protein